MEKPISRPYLKQFKQTLEDKDLLEDALRFLTMACPPEGCGIFTRSIHEVNDEECSHRSCQACWLKFLEERRKSLFDDQ